MKDMKPTKEQLAALKRAVELGKMGDRTMFSENEVKNLEELYDILKDRYAMIH